MGKPIRTDRLEELIRAELNLLFQHEVQDPELAGVTVTRVELSRDVSRVRVWFWGGGDEVMDALERATGFLRRELAETLALKRTPELTYRRDPATRAFEPEGT